MSNSIPLKIYIDPFQVALVCLFNDLCLEVIVEDRDLFVVSNDIDFFDTRIRTRMVGSPCVPSDGVDSKDPDDL